MEGSALYKVYPFDPKQLRAYQDVKVREQCKSCKRYGTKATCPPYVESFKYYDTLLFQYDNGCLFVEEFPIDDTANWQQLGRQSSKVILQTVLEYRNVLLKQGRFAVGFGAGSCKICNVCRLPNCRFPEKSLIPIEATGINVIKLVKLIANIEIEFPVVYSFYRIGMLLWDNL